MKYLEVFSGIGGFREAANLISRDLCIEMSCIGHIENDEDANNLYDAHFHPDKDEFFMKDLHDYRKRVESGRTTHELNIGDFDIMFARVPKERYSNANAIDDKVFTDLIFLVKKCLPEIVLIETSSTMFKYNNGKSLQHIFQCLGDLGYFCNIATISAKDFGSPQERNKMYILATTRKESEMFGYNGQEIKRSFFCNGLNNSTIQHSYVWEILEQDVRDLSLWLSDSAKKFIFAEEYNGRQLYPKPNQTIAMSLKPNMCKMQRANADNYYTYDFIRTRGMVNDMLHKTPQQMAKIDKIRRLTHLECIRLQGFEDSLFEEAMWAYVGDTALYRVIADSTNVNMAYAVIKHVLLGFGFVNK